MPTIRAEFRHRTEFVRDEGGADRRARDVSYARAFAADGAIPGWCTACGATTRFRYEPMGSDGPPNFREMLHCVQCGLFSRIRHALAIADGRRPLCQSRIYATEMATPLYAWLRRGEHDVIGSEYVTDVARRASLDAYVATITEGRDTALRVEDVTRLTLADASRDLVLSFDVLEHVPDYRAALRELRRVLAPGGMLVATVPFDVARDDTLVRASIGGDGAVVHHVEPEYHGDPASDAGCLAFYTFGWSLLDDLRDAGFDDPRWVVDWSPACGWLGAQWTLVAETTG